MTGRVPGPVDRDTWMRRFRMIARTVFAIALLACCVVPAGCADRDAGQVKTADADGSFMYLVSGRSVQARLAVYDWVPSGWEQSPEEAEGREGTVFLRDRLWYPNPFSGPEAFLVVTETSSFRLDILDGDADPLESFAFERIDPGLYRFGLEQPLPPRRRCTLRLVRDGVPAGDMEIFSDHGSRGR
jgi:hypothetical protein